MPLSPFSLSGFPAREMPQSPAFLDKPPSGSNLPERAGPTGLPSTEVGGRPARGRPAGQIRPGTSSIPPCPGSPGRRFPGAPRWGGRGRGAAGGCAAPAGSAASPAPGAGPGAAAAHGCGECRRRDTHCYGRIQRWCSACLRSWLDSTCCCCLGSPQRV